MKHKVGNKVILNKGDKGTEVYTIKRINSLDSEHLYELYDYENKSIGWYAEEELLPAGNLIDPDEAIEEFQRDLKNGFYNEFSPQEIYDLVDAKTTDTTVKDKESEHRSTDNIGILGIYSAGLASIKQNEYERGKKDGYEARKAEESKSAKAVVGYETEIMQDEYERGKKDGFDEGMNTAWEVARKISHMDNRELADIHFEVNVRYPGNVNAVNIIADYTAQEALEKIKAYGEIKVGDVVKVFADKGIVVAISNDCATVLYSDGSFEGISLEHITKTGKRIDIQSMLDGLKES